MDNKQILVFPDASDASTREEQTFGTPFDNVDDLSVLEYARLYGLCKDFLSENPVSRQLLPHPPCDNQDDSEDIIGITILKDATESALKERLVIEKEAASFLRAIFTLQHTDIEEDTTLPRRRIADLKQELPLLKTDDELDLQRFGEKAARDFRNINLPLEIVDNDKDEGLEWSFAHYDLPAHYYSQAHSEKLEISRDALLYLQATFKEPSNGVDMDEIALAELQYRRNTAIDPVTPPLLSLTPPLAPFVPSSPAGQLELLSDRTDPIVEETKALERELCKEDAILPLAKDDQPDDDSMLLDHGDIGQIYSPLRSIGKTASSPVQRKHTDLKVEVPLTPPTTLQSSNQHVKSVSFAEKLREYIPMLPLTDERSDDLLGSQNSFEAFLKEQVAPLADKANRTLEQEQLQEADSTKRVQVPVMDFSLPRLAWITYMRGIQGMRRESKTELDAQRELMARVKREELKFIPQWRGIAKIERQLSWSPFPVQLGKVAVDESIEDDGALSELLTVVSLEDVADSASLIWKPEGLRILDDLDGSEDELELTSFEEKSDMKSLPRKRKLQLDNVMDYGHAAEAGMVEMTIPGQEARVQSSEGCTIPTSSSSHMDQGTDLPKGNSDLIFGGLFSASTALSKFMETQGMIVKKPKLEGLPEAISSTKAQLATSDRSKHTSISTEQRPSTSKAVQPTSQAANAQSLPGPKIPSHLPQRSLIISSTLLTQRRLIQRMQTLYSSLELIERDFTAHRKQPTTLADEADIILSPATGILCTTLQKIKQRALPGRTGRAGVKERMQVVAARYQRLLVYVSEGKTTTTGPTNELHALDDRDCEALASLIGFAGSLDADVQVTYVAGGEEELARWIVSAALRFGANAADTDGAPESVKLLQDETLWELFLRRAGLNAFAAQVILAALKPPAPTPNEQSSSSPLTDSVSAKRGGVYGLTAFVTMAPDERLRRFQGLMGGTSVLERVNRLLEQLWVSAANGVAG